MHLCMSVVLSMYMRVQGRQARDKSGEQNVKKKKKMEGEMSARCVASYFFCYRGRSHSKTVALSHNQVD